MKKVLLVAAVAGLAMASCKKDYTCECTASAGGVSATASTTIHDTKKKAEDACTAKNTSANGATTECKIK
jgi:hypothetical protein